MVAAAVIVTMAMVVFLVVIVFTTVAFVLRLTVRFVGVIVGGHIL